MENTPHEGKENASEANDFQINYSLIHGSNIQFLSSGMQKKSKIKVKPQKGFSSNLRAGDWVCLVCNNLNFSFRNECNRCQIQTKEQNQIQSLYISDNQSNQTRSPLTDLTNQKYNQLKSGPPTFHSKSKSTPMQSDLNLIHISHQATVLDTNRPLENGGTNLEFGPNSPLNHGFQNKLLVTPPKHRQNKSLNIFKEYSDSSQKELPPYKSPEHLPSVSPILKKVFGYDFKGNEDSNSKVHQNLASPRGDTEERRNLAEDSCKTKDMMTIRGINKSKEDQGPFANVSLRNTVQVKGQSRAVDERSSNRLTNEPTFFWNSQAEEGIENRRQNDSFRGESSSTNNGNFEE